MESVGFIIIFFVGILEILFYPKCSEKINALKIIVMGTMAILCYQSLAAFIFYKLHVAVNIKTIGLAMLALDILLGVGIIYKRRIQKVFIRLIDVINMAIIVVVVLFVSNHIFSTDLGLQYANGDAAAHFSFAMEIVRSENIARHVYFSALIDAMFIEVLAPALSAVQYYKAFILADIFMHVLEVLMFYILAITISDKKTIRYSGAVLSLVYFWGYPAYSYMEGNFVYWSNGVMILIFMIYALTLLEKQRQPRMKMCVGILLVLGLYANTCCNRLFVPVNSLAVFAALVVMFWPKCKKKVNKKVFLGIGIGTALIIAGAVRAYFRVWGTMLANIVLKGTSSGGIYRAMYADLIFFLPPFFVLCYLIVKKKSDFKIIWTICICMIASTIAMYIFWYHYILSTYYYYKIYYNLWLLGWLITIQVLDWMERNGKLPAAFSYVGMITVMVGMVITDYDDIMSVEYETYNASYATNHLLPLYAYNTDLLSQDYAEKRTSDKVLDVYNYVIEQCQGESIPMIISDGVEMIWYDALAGMSSQEYRIDTLGFADILPLLDQGEISKIIVIKNDESYQIYQAYFENCTVVYGNDEAAILSPKGESWSDPLTVAPDYSQEKTALFEYISNLLAGEQVPLLAAESAYVDFFMYNHVVEMSSAEYYTWNQGFEDMINTLNENQIKYVVLLKDDIFYQENRSYFGDAQVIYENEAGMLLKCVGESW
jgi:hypothetical protein